MDENGIMLSVQEVRERLRDGRPVILNEESQHGNEPARRLPKNINLDMLYGQAILYSIKADDVLLCPSDPNAENFFQAKYVVNDDAWFWQSPYQESKKQMMHPAETHHLFNVNRPSVSGEQMVCFFMSASCV